MSKQSIGYIALLRRNRKFRRLWYGHNPAKEPASLTVRFPQALFDRFLSIVFNSGLRSIASTAVILEG